MGRWPSSSSSSEKNGVKKGPWTPEEDTKLIQYIEAHGAANWRNLPKNAGLQRCGKSCRLRWTNYLRPDIKRGRFSFDEEETIIQLHTVLGNKWSAIAARLPGRTDNEIKNYWNTHIRKRLLRSGIDPITHAPRLDLLLRSPHPNANANLNLLRLLNTLLSSSNSTFLQNHIIGALPIQPNHSQYNNYNQHIPPNLNNNFSQETNNFMIATDHQSCLLPTDFCYGVSDQTTADFSQNSSFHQSISNTSNNNSHDFTFDSLLSTPLSSPPPSLAPSSLINGGGQDETESFCTSLFKSEIQESWDFDDLFYL